MVLEIEYIDIIGLGSGPLLILVHCEEPDANSHVCRTRVSVQPQIHVSLVISAFSRKKKKIFLLQELSKRCRKAEPKIINLSKLTEFTSSSLYP